MSEATALGALLGVMVQYGMSNVQNATAALKAGKANSEQQLICWKIIEACNEKDNK